MKKLKLLKAGSYIAALLLMFMIASPATAQDTTSTNNSNGQFLGWDTDQSGDLSEEEFNAGITETGYYGTWDADGNGTLTEEEWNTGMEENLRGYDSEYQQWDEDGDGDLTEDEFYRGTYNTLDENRNSTLDGSEWGNWYQEGIF